MINQNKSTEATLTIKAETITQMHIPYNFVVFSVLIFVLLLIRQILDN